MSEIFDRCTHCLSSVSLTCAHLARTQIFSLFMYTNTHIHTQGFTHQQMATVEDSTVMIEEREREITAIVQSISDINEMYRDLATMVVDQVCVLLNPITDVGVAKIL